MRSALSLFMVLRAFALFALDMPDERAFLNKEIANIEVLTVEGHWVKLFDLFKGKPVIISPIYTRCPKACSVITAGLQAAVQTLGTLGRDFTIITFSFDHRDTEKDLQVFTERWQFDNDDWRIVTSDSLGIRELLASMDYEIEYDPDVGQYAHPNVVIMLSAKGKIMQYIYGMRPRARDIRIAALNAKQEVARLGIVEGFYLKCFQYDPVTGTYKFDWSFLIELVAGLLITSVCSVLVYKAFLHSPGPETAA